MGAPTAYPQNIVCVCLGSPAEYGRRENATAGLPPVLLLLRSSHLFLCSGFTRSDRFSMLVCFSVCFQQYYKVTSVSGFLNGIGMVGIGLYWEQKTIRHIPVLPLLTDSKPIYRLTMHHNSMTVNCGTRERTYATNTMHSTHCQLLFFKCF